MATRSEQFRAMQSRRGQSKAARKKRAMSSKPGIAASDRSREKVHAGKKATYALETVTTARPTRKSTRKSANRSKPDAAFNLREELQKGSPQERFRKASVKAG